MIEVEHKDFQVSSNNYSVTELTKKSYVTTVHRKNILCIELLKHS